MNINDFAKANAVALYLESRVGKSATSVSPAAQAGLKKADQRIQAQLDTTTAQLSALGQLQSAVSDAQTAARNLTRLPSSSSATVQKAAASQFVVAFNRAIGSAHTPVAGATAPQGASRAGQDVLQALGSSTGLPDAVKKLGFSLASDGTLAFDSHSFDAALKADPGAALAGLSQLGQQTVTSTSKALASDTRLGASLASLNQRSSVLKGQQTMLASLGLSVAAGQSVASEGAYDFGLAAYRKSLGTAF